METERRPRKSYPSDVSDEEWVFVARYRTLMTPAAPRRKHDLHEVFNALRWIVRIGAPWRYLPTTLPPWEAVYQQIRRWLDAGCFDAMVRDPRVLLRWRHGRADQPTAAIVDSVARQSTPESGARAGYDGYTRPQGSTIHEGVMQIEVVKVAEAKRGFVLLPHRLVGEHSIAWVTHFRRLANDYERLPERFKGCISSPLPA